MSILVNPSFRELLNLAPPASSGARAVIMGDNIGIAESQNHIHKDIVDRMRGAGIPVAEPYIELYIDALSGDFRIHQVANVNLRDWRKVASKKHQQTLDDLCKIFGDSAEC